MAYLGTNKILQYILTEAYNFWLKFEGRGHQYINALEPRNLATTDVYLLGHIYVRICTIVDIQHRNPQFQSYPALLSLSLVENMHRHKHTWGRINMILIQNLWFTFLTNPEISWSSNFKYECLHEIIKTRWYSFINFARDKARRGSN